MSNIPSANGSPFSKLHWGKLFWLVTIFTKTPHISSWDDHSCQSAWESQCMGVYRQSLITINYPTIQWFISMVTFTCTHLTQYISKQKTLAAQCTSLLWILSYTLWSTQLRSPGHSCLRTNKVGKATSHPRGFIAWCLTAFISSQISWQSFLTSRQLITLAFSFCYSHKKWKGILIHSWATRSLAYTHAGPPSPQEPKIGRAWVTRLIMSYKTPTSPAQSLSANNIVTLWVLFRYNQKSPLSHRKLGTLWGL